MFFYLLLAFRFCARADAKFNGMTILAEFKQLLDDDFLTAILILIEVQIAIFIIVAVFYNMILKSWCWDLSFKYQDRKNIFVKAAKYIAGWTK